MGLVTDTLLKLLQRQIEAHRTLVWYDPEHAYLDLASSLTPEQVAGAAVYRYESERGCGCAASWSRSGQAGQTHPGCSSTYPWARLRPRTRWRSSRWAAQCCAPARSEVVTHEASGRPGSLVSHLTPSWPGAAHVLQEDEAPYGHGEEEAEGSTHG